MRETSERPRVWQRMLSGRRLDLLDPQAEDIEIGDIAHGLARVARWNGQTSGRHAYSVAQHSLLVEHLFAAASPRSAPIERLAALLHDAPEYVIGDLISPFKAVLEGRYREVETRLLDAVHARFDLAGPATRMGRAIKAADRVAAYFEAIHLAGFEDAEARIYFGQPDAIDRGAVMPFLDPWSTADAQERFEERFWRLGGR